MAMNANGNWDLTPIYKGFDDPAYAADGARVIEMMAQLEEMLKNQGGEGYLQALVEKLEQTSELLSRISSLGSLTLSTDAGNKAALAQQDKTMKMSMCLQQITSGVNAYVGALSDLEEQIAADAFLGERAYFLRNMKNNYEHLIDPALEPTVLKMRMSGGHAWSQLRGQLDAGHLIDIELGGEKKQLPLSAVRGLAYSADQNVRKTAYEAEIGSYPKMETAMAACLNGIKMESITMAGLKKYDSPLDAAIEMARIDRETLDALLTAMRESLPGFRRYFRLKAKALGHEGGLPFYELFAPVGGCAKEYKIEEARDLLVDVMGGFSKKMANFIAEMFDENRIDIYPHAGKRGGAFCSGVHAIKKSYVMTNFDGSLSSVGTLAHELGHAYHGLCMKDTPLFASRYPMPLAETASIFNETLFSDVLKKRFEGNEKLAMIEQELADSAQVIVDILSRFLFEDEVFRRRHDHAMTPEELCDIMTDAQKQTYGDGLDENYLHPYMWACKSHYYSPGLDYYNFPYAFGLLFGKGVFALYQKMGKDFLPLYDDLLRRTGAGNVREVAASVGIDVADVNFWRSSLKVVLDGVDEMEKLLG